MPIKSELRWFYPIDWPQISRQVRFDAPAAAAKLRSPIDVRCLPDGRWYDTAASTWRNGRGRPAPGPFEDEPHWHPRVVLAAAHLDHNPANDGPRNLRVFASAAI